MNQRMKVKDYVESIFDISYLLIVIVLGIYYLTKATTDSFNTSLLLYGIMSLTLGIGDSFHLIPRVLSSFSKQPEKYTKYLGAGKMITSISMTVFYVFLFYIHKYMYGEIMIFAWMDMFIIILAITRIALCLMPQNKWLNNKDDNEWSIYRNIPFLLLGLCIIALFSVTSITYMDAFKWMPIAITASFLFYVPVVLFASKYRAVGMLMLPKTIMYLWIVWMGMSLLA